VSAVSELEVREWLEEQEARAEEQDAGGELPLFLPTPDFMASTGGGVGGRGALFLCFFPLSISLGASTFLRGTGLGGGQRGACNEPPLRGQRTGKRTVHILAMISIGRMRVMNKQKKKEREPEL